MALGRLPLEIRTFWAALSVKALIQSAARSCAADLTGMTRSEPPMKFGSRSPFGPGSAKVSRLSFSLPVLSVFGSAAAPPSQLAP